MLDARISSDFGMLVVLFPGGVVALRLSHTSLFSLSLSLGGVSWAGPVAYLAVGLRDSSHTLSARQSSCMLESCLLQI